MPNYTAEEVAKMLVKADGTPVDPSRVRQLAGASKGAIGTKFAGVWMFTDEDVSRLKERHNKPGPAPGPESKPRKRKPKADTP